MVRIVLAALLGAILGAERDLHGRPAGLRTSMMIAIGACLFTILSYMGFAGSEGSQDPTRIASQIVIGVGFLGGGVLLKGHKEIIGLTTAANIWIVAAIGMAVGAGMEKLAIFATIIAIVILSFLRPVSHHLEAFGRKRMKARGGVVIRED